MPRGKFVCQRDPAPPPVRAYGCGLVGTMTTSPITSRRSSAAVAPKSISGSPPVRITSVTRGERRTTHTRLPSSESVKTPTAGHNAHGERQNRQYTDRSTKRVQQRSIRIAMDHAIEEDSASFADGIGAFVRSGSPLRKVWMNWRPIGVVGVSISAAWQRDAAGSVASVAFTQGKSAGVIRPPQGAHAQSRSGQVLHEGEPDLAIDGRFRAGIVVAV